jgi:hypothetical protein
MFSTLLMARNGVVEAKQDIVLKNFSAKLIFKRLTFVVIKMSSRFRDPLAKISVSSSPIWASFP